MASEETVVFAQACIMYPITQSYRSQIQNRHPEAYIHAVRLYQNLKRGDGLTTAIVPGIETKFICKYGATLQ